jgi:transcription elongation factor GreA
MGSETGGAALLREVGLLPDGPGVWGRPLTTHRPGVYVVELAEPLPAAPLELTRIGKWMERLPDLQLDGTRPVSRAVAARLASLWLPAETVLYVGATTGSIGGRVLSMAKHVLGDRRPHADGQWLHALSGIERARIWWAETEAPEEYLDALFEAFAAGAGVRAARPGGIRDGRPAEARFFPWANTRRPTGERQAHGLTGMIAAETAEPTPPPPGTLVTALPPGDADGARTAERGTGTIRRGSAAAPPIAGSMTRTRGTTKPPGGPGRGSRVEPVPLTREAHTRTEVELDQLTRVQRPDVVARIKAAREHGDLKENAEYQAAREEQSFLEGRVRLLEERLRHAVIIEEDRSGRVVLGSSVVVEHDGETFSYTIVGSAEADPSGGRLSASSPVGAALLGAVPGAQVQVRTPRGAAVYRVLEVR